MKKPIAWHEECLKNATESLARDEAEFKRMVECRTEELQRSRLRVHLLSAQISEAKRRGKDGFDNDKFLVNRKPAGQQ